MTEGVRGGNGGGRRRQSLRGHTRVKWPVLPGKLAGPAAEEADFRLWISSPRPSSSRSPRSFSSTSSLAGDNAIVVGIAVAGLPLQQRWRVMVLGIAAATLLRIVFASFTVQLLDIIGLLLAGGLLLLWVCWKLWRELRSGPAHRHVGRAFAARGRRRERLTPSQRARAAEDDASGRDADHRGRRLDVARQRARRRRRRARACLGVDLRARVVGRVHGSCGGRHRAAARALSLDRLRRASRSFFTSRCA